MPVSSTAASISMSDIDCDRENKLCGGGVENPRASGVPCESRELDFSLDRANTERLNNGEFVISGDDSNDEKYAAFGDD